MAVAKTKVSSMHNTHHRMDSLDGKEKYRGAGGTITHHTSLNRSLEIPRRNLQDDEEISNLNGSGFIRIEGEGDYLEGVETR